MAAEVTETEPSELMIINSYSLPQKDEGAESEEELMKVCQENTDPRTVVLTYKYSKTL